MDSGSVLLGKKSERSGYRIQNILQIVGAERIPDQETVINCRSGADIGFGIKKKIGEERISDSVFKIFIGAEQIPDF